MNFSSALFLFAFLPITYILYIAVPGRASKIKNLILIAASLIFYAFGEPVYILLMLFSVAVNYLLGLLVGRPGGAARAALAVSVVFNVSVLFIFKYTDFILQNLNGIFSLNIPLPGISLPIGISFFTFQSMSYVIDVYRKPEICQKNFANVLLYISFFPQLIAGPIVRYEDISAELSERHIYPEEAAEGFRRFIFGLSKKLIAANTMGSAASLVFTEMDKSHYNALACWCGAIFYTLQIYYDFSGYSDMAIGLGRMFGFHFNENFNYPFSARNIKDFWRRWHISLSSWFRSYVYIPLGGNRKGAVRTVINKYIVFFLTGFWHGAGWNFIIWGLMHGTALTLSDNIDKLSKKKISESIIGRIFSLLVVIVAFVFFNSDTLSDALVFIKAMFTGFDFSAVSDIIAVFSPWFVFVLAASVVFSLPLTTLIKKHTLLSQNKTVAAVTCAASYIIALLLLAFCVITVPSAEYNPFIYFRF